VDPVSKQNVGQPLELIMELPYSCLDTKHVWQEYIYTTPDDEDEAGGVGDQGYVNEFLRSMGEFLDFEDDYGDHEDEKLEAAEKDACEAVELDMTTQSDRKGVTNKAKLRKKRRL
jgi:hypothetical protein